MVNTCLAGNEGRSACLPLGSGRVLRRGALAGGVHEAPQALLAVRLQTRRPGAIPRGAAELVQGRHMRGRCCRRQREGTDCLGKQNIC